MDLRAYANFNIMFLDNKSFTLREYWQIIKDYKWRVLRLSFLICVLALLIVSTLPSTYLGTARLQLSPQNTALTNAIYLPFAKTSQHKELKDVYQKKLSENIAKGVLIKLKKFKLRDLDSELEKAILEYEIIAPIKQKKSAVLPFMPQQQPDRLSPKQLSKLKNNYTLEKILQSLQLRYASSQREIYIDYKDRSATLAVIIAKLAADLYMQSVSETKIQIFEYVEKQIKLTNNQSPPISKISDTTKNSDYTFQIVGLGKSIKLSSQDIYMLNQISSFSRKQLTDSNILIGNYTTKLLKPNRVLILILSFFLSVLVTSSLAFILERLKAKDRQKTLLVDARQKL